MVGLVTTDMSLNVDKSKAFRIAVISVANFSKFIVISIFHQLNKHRFIMVLNSMFYVQLKCRIFWSERSACAALG